ncbi:MAG: chemotaxis protein CheW [Methylotenera sp.]|nr:chemotaxis protein CheW [Methylotenera sp.]
MFRSLNNFSATEAITNKEESAWSEYLTFALGTEIFGLELLKVQEIRGYDAVTQIANTPDFINGSVNLRGMIVPIVDLRIKFKLGKVEYDESTVVIILNMNGQVASIVVDDVSDIIAIEDNEVRGVSSLATAIDTKYIVGLATPASQLLVLIDTDQLLCN